MIDEFIFSLLILVIFFVISWAVIRTQKRYEQARVMETRAANSWKDAADMYFTAIGAKQAAQPAPQPVIHNPAMARTQSIGPWVGPGSIASAIPGTLAGNGGWPYGLNHEMAPLSLPVEAPENDVIVAYKAFRLTHYPHYQLKALATGFTYDGPEHTAQCSHGMAPLDQKSPLAALCQRHLRNPADHGDHNCGVFAFKDAVSAFHEGEEVVAQVALGGLVVEADYGYRAEHVRIDKLYIAPHRMIGPTIEQLQARYLCPVEQLDVFKMYEIDAREALETVPEDSWQTSEPNDA